MNKNDLNQIKFQVTKVFTICMLQISSKLISNLIDLKFFAYVHMTAKYKFESVSNWFESFMWTGEMLMVVLVIMLMFRFHNVI